MTIFLSSTGGGFWLDRLRGSRNEHTMSRREKTVVIIPDTEVGVRCAGKEIVCAICPKAAFGPLLLCACVWWETTDSLYDDAEEVVGMLAWFSLSCKAVNDVASDKFQAEPRHPQSDRFFWCRVSRVFIFWEVTRGCRLDRVCRPGILP